MYVVDNTYVSACRIGGTADYMLLALLAWENEPFGLSMCSILAFQAFRLCSVVVTGKNSMNIVQSIYTHYLIKSSFGRLYPSGPRIRPWSPSDDFFFNFV